MEELRRCKGKCNIYENGKWHSLEFGLGYFHEWGMNYEEFVGSGPGNYSVAIVELPDGRIGMPTADDIAFLDPLGSGLG